MFQLLKNYEAIIFDPNKYIMPFKDIYQSRFYFFNENGKKYYYELVFVEDVTNKHYAAHNSLYCFGIAT